MKIGILYTSHPDPVTEPFPYHAVHARTTKEILEAEELGFDSVWIAEHHFSNKYGILPDPFSYLCYLAALTRRIKLCAGVMVVPLHHPMRIVENAAFVDILSNGRFQLGLGSGYRHGSPDTVIRKIEALRDIGATSVMLHYPPYYGAEKTSAMLRLFAKEVLPHVQAIEAPRLAAD